MNHTHVYIYPAEYAREHGELEAYRASSKADIACKEAIEAAIRDHYRNNRLDTSCVKQVSDEFGYERMLRVLANTVRQKDWDGRISRDNKVWAQTIPIYANPDGWGQDRNVYFVVESHPGLTDLFVTQARKEYAREREKPKERDSVLAKLRKPKVEPSMKAPSPKAKRQELEP